MKDYKSIEGLQDNIRVEVKAAYDKGYKQGFHDGEGSYLVSKKKEKEAIEAYQKGLDDAWKCLRKILDRHEDGMQAEVFGTKYYPDILEKYSASEAIAKIREYEEKQAKKNCDNCQYKDKLDAKCLFCDKEQDAEIKVGDEVIYHGAPHDGDIGVVIGSKDDWREVRFLSSWSSIAVSKDTLTKTGRTFPTIKMVLEAMEEGE